MTLIFGTLGLADTDRVFNATVGQRVVYDMAVEFVNGVNADVQRQISMFVAATTPEYKHRYKLPGGGRMQKMGFDPQTTPAAVRAYGGWDVAYPLEEYGDAISGTRVSMAYMTVAELERHIMTVVQRNATTMRFEMLRRLFKNTTDTFPDPLAGDLTVQPLANGDAVLYPPVVGSESEATDTHYLESGYAAANISNTNNPFPVIEAELTEHFGKSQGNDNILVFINSAQTAVVEALGDFIELPDRFEIPGAQISTLTGLPSVLPMSARIIGRTNGCWVAEWDWVPANYAVGIHLDPPPPLVMRVDPEDTGLGSGLQLIATNEDEPFESSYWSHRYGFGVGNRLNGVVMEFGTGGTYTIPTAYQ